ncbi:pentatricopeptide repeat-containing protein, partial [Quercus suber]
DKLNETLVVEVLSPVQNPELGCCRNGLWNLALEELGRLKDFRYKPTRWTYNALFLKADQLDTVYLVHREMSSSGFSMDEFTLGCFAQSLCKAGRWREALSLFEKEEIVPNTVLYTKMISGLCEASLFEEAMDFLNRMRTSSCIPNVVTHRTLLCGCLRKRQLGRCKRTLSMMITEGCYPSPKIFNSLVHAFCRSGDYSYAYKLLKKMVKCSCQPGYVIGSICGNEELPSSDVLELAEKAYGEMLDAGVVLNKVNVSNFARCLCGAGKFERAYTVIREMTSKGFIPDTSTYAKVIGFLCNASKVEKAFLLFEEMKRNGIVPDVYTYTILIDSFCKAVLIKRARNWFDEMVRDGCAPNVVTYTALIHAYLKARKLSNANDLFEIMCSEGGIPNVITYTVLIDGHCKAGEIEKACQIYARMRGNVEIYDVDMYFRIDDGNSKEPNVFTYGALVDGLCKAHKVKEARNLLDAMVLINHYCAIGLLDEAHKLLDEMKQTYWPRHRSSYCKVIEGFNREFIISLGLLDEISENDSFPIVPVYRILIDSFIKAGRLESALELHEEIPSFFPLKAASKNMYTSLIESLSRAGKVVKAFELYTDMVRMGGVAELSTFVHLIKGLININKWEEALQLSDSICQMVSLSLSTFSLLKLWYTLWKQIMFLPIEVVSSKNFVKYI